MKAAEALEFFLDNEDITKRVTWHAFYQGSLVRANSGDEHVMDGPCWCQPIVDDQAAGGHCMCCDWAGSDRRARS